MRHEPAERLLRLALYLAGTAEGRSLLDIRGEFEVSPRTAERLLDAVRRLFPVIERANPDEKAGRWRLPGGLGALTNIDAAELTELDAAAHRLHEDNLPERAAELERLALKVRSAMRPNLLRRTETDVEALLEAEGLAMRPGPRPQLPAGLLATIREAILRSCRLRIRYLPAHAAAPVMHLVDPYGLLYGARAYLVGPMDGWSSPALLRLDRIAEAVIADERFERDPAFVLSEFAARSFGVFQEEPIDIRLRFSRKVAAEAALFRFHPTQIVETLPDGRLQVCFTAGGRLELCQHLAGWGCEVEIVEPPDLAAQLADMGDQLARHHRTSLPVG